MLVINKPKIHIFRLLADTFINWQTYSLRNICMYNDLQQRENIKIHRLFSCLLVAQFILSVVIGFITNTLMLGIVAGLIIVVLPLYFSLSKPNATASKHIVAVAIQLMASLHMQQTMGMTEMHFQVFVLLAFLSFFRDWKVIVTGTAVVALHHIAGFISQSMGGSLIVFEAAQPALLILLIHATFAVVESVVLVFMAHRAAGEHDVAMELNSAIQKIMANDGSIDLSEDNIPKNPNLREFTNLLAAVRTLAEQSSHVGLRLVDIASKVRDSSNVLDSSVADQSHQVNTISESMQDISNSIDNVANLSQNANSIADGAKTSTQNTRTAIESSQSNIAHLKSTLTTTSTAIADLSSKCENISTVMQSIKSVAEQTNLLALNAAIESARAGEHGRGFAVVADEVRNLAIKSKESAEEIEQITSLLTNSANHSVSNMNECVDMVELAVESSESATANMKEVFKSIEQVNVNVTQVADSTTDQTKISQSISVSTDQLNDLFVCERDQVSGLQQDVSELNKLSDELSAQMSLFKFA